MEDGEIKISEYNEGIAQIYRLDNLWKLINSHAMNGSYQKWNDALDRVWQELVADLKKQMTYEKKQEDLKKLDSDIANLQPFRDSGGGFNKINKDELIKRSKQYKKLMEKEEFLRRLQNEVGKGTKNKDEDDDDF